MATPPSPPILGMYETSGAFPVPGPSAWPSGPTTNLSATYMAWGQDWATYAGAFVTECNSNGLIPFVELEPWESGDSWDVTPLFSDITGGTWDTWLEGVGTAIAATGQPVILTFAHEMNVSGQYPWSQGDTGSGPGGGALSASEWIAGWNYVRAKVNSTAGGLAIWMWACSAYTGGTNVSPAPWWPGASEVDMVGIDGYPDTTYGESLGTFAGQIEPTVSIIRGLGWTSPIFISETNLAQMVNGGGESITSFVADMYAAGISGILEFEDAAWDLPQMTSAQWTEYNAAITANYGGGGGGGGGGTFAAVGPGFASTSKTFTLTPTAIGDFILAEVISLTSSDPATAVSSSNVTWRTLVPATTIGSYACTVFIGKVTSASAATVTVTTAGSPTVRTAGHEYSCSDGYGAVTLDKSGTVNAGAAFPSLTPAAAGEMYWSFCFAASGTTAGSTSGYSYYTDPNENPMAWDTSAGAGAQAPNIGSTDELTGTAVLLYAASGAPSGLLMAGIA